MKYVSTRDSKVSVNFTQALLEGIASDGGLFVPESWPWLDIEKLSKTENYADFAFQCLLPFVGEEALTSKLQDICREAFDFTIPLVPLKSQTAVLELFHGPTCAFKDVGARFLAGCMQKILGQYPSGKKNIVLVATSGDTGGAVAAAFYKKANIEVKVLFPARKISARQEKQLTAWGENVQAFAIEGNFDDCQAMVKQALVHQEFKTQINFISANSINLGRILPQMVYYAFASLQYQKQSHKLPGFIIPSGNLGNSLAAVWAWKLGFPIREIILATNANKSVLNYATTGNYKGLPTVSTLANAMDVGHPSNMERYLNLFNHEQFKNLVKVVSVEDVDIENAIRQGEKDWGQIWCPHTATAVWAREQEASSHWIIVATAHPAKFESIVEPLVKHEVAIPNELKEILKKPSQVIHLKPDLALLKKYF